MTRRRVIVLVAALGLLSSLLYAFGDGAPGWLSVLRSALRLVGVML